MALVPIHTYKKDVQETTHTQINRWLRNGTEKRPTQSKKKWLRNDPHKYAQETILLGTQNDPRTKTE